MFFGCSGQNINNNVHSSSSVSVHAYSSSSYQPGGIHNRPQASRQNFFTTCLQAVCGVDPSNSVGRKYSTTMEDNSSITAFTNHNLNFDDECRITLNRFSKKVNGREIRYIQAKATLYDDEVDEAHDLFYLVKMPENSSVTTLQHGSPDHTERMRANKINASTSQPQYLQGKNLENAYQKFGALVITPQDSRYSNNSLSGSQFGPSEVPLHQKLLNNTAGQLEPSVEENKVLIKDSGSDVNKQNATGALAYLRATSKQTSENKGPINVASHLNPDHHVNQNTGSFTFHPYLNGSASGTEKSHFNNTHNSSQPNLLPTADVLGKFISVHSQDGGLEGTETLRQRCDTETERQRIEDNGTEDDDALVLSKDKKTKQTSFTANFPKEASLNNFGAESSASSQLLFDKTRGITAAGSNKRIMPRLPKTYGDLIAKFTVSVKRDTERNLSNVAIGQFPLSKVPDGKYRIYYFRPKNRNRLIGQNASSTAQDKIQRVGKGQEFYIFDKNTSSQSPSKQSIAESYQYSMELRQNHSQSFSQSSTHQEMPTVHNPLMQNLNAGSESVQTKLKVGLLPKDKKPLGSIRKFPGVSSQAFQTKMQAANKTGIDSDVDLKTPRNQIHRREIKELSNLSPDEVDALVCNPIDSQETDPISKDSFNTEKIRQENLCQRIGITQMNDAYGPGQNQVFSLGAGHESGVASFGMLTFGHNSPNDAMRSVGSGTNSTSDLHGNNFGALSGLQELCEVHEKVNLIPHTKAPLPSSNDTNSLANNRPSKSISNSNHSAKNAQRGLECPDTPNLYQTISHASQYTQSVEVSVTTESQLGYKPPTVESKQPPGKNGMVTQTRIISRLPNSQPFPQDELPSDIIEIPAHFGASQTQKDRPLQHCYSNDSNNFALRLHEMESSSPPSHEIKHSRDLHRQAPLGLNNHLQTETDAEKQRKNSAIRVEKQASYSKSQTNSSLTESGSHNKQALQNDFEKSEDYREGSSNNVPSAFEAAEYKVRKSLLKSKEAYQDHKIDSFDIVAVDKEEDGGRFRQTDYLNSRPFDESDCAQVITVQSNTQHMERLINQLQISPDNELKSTDQPVTTDGNSSIPDENQAQAETKQIYFLQQLIDTRGPQENVFMEKPGEGVITVLQHPHGAAGSVIQSQAPFNSLVDTPQLGQQKHSRAIAFTDGTANMIDGELSPTANEEESESFQSPNKAAYREMIKLANSQNQIGANFDQMTRNTGNAPNNSNPNQNQNRPGGTQNGYSDRKQLSTVEEENASQCSDLTSINQHTSRFMLTQHSSMSRKSLRNSIQPGVVNGPSPNHISGAQMIQLSNSGKKPTSFCISEEEASDTEKDNQTQKKEVQRVPEMVLVESVDSTDHGTVQQKLIAGRKVSYQGPASSNDLVEEDTEERVKISLPNFGNISGNSTKTCSKQTSTAALSNSNFIQGNQNIVNFTGQTSARLNDSQQRKQVQMQTMNSDYYILKTSSLNENTMTIKGNLIRDMQMASPELINSQDKSSSSLLDLDNTDFNLTSQLLSPRSDAEKKQDSQLINTEEIVDEATHHFSSRALISSSPYMIVQTSPVAAKETNQRKQENPEQEFKQERVSDFGIDKQESDHDQKQNAPMPVTQDIVTEGKDEEDMIDSVHLSCSEKLVDSSKEVITEQKETEDSALIMRLIDQIPEPDQLESTPRIPEKNIIAQKAIQESPMDANLMAKNSADTLNSNSSKKHRPLKSSQGSKKTWSTGKSVSAQKLASTQSTRNHLQMSSKENIFALSPAATLHGKSHAHSLSKSKQLFKKSHGNLGAACSTPKVNAKTNMTPLIQKPGVININNKHVGKQHQLYQKSILSPQIHQHQHSSSAQINQKKKKVELKTSERKLTFNPMGPPTASTASVLLLTPRGQGKLVQSNVNEKVTASKMLSSDHVPPQPLLKQKHMLVAGSHGRNHAGQPSSSNKQLFLQTIQAKASQNLASDAAAQFVPVSSPIITLPKKVTSAAMSRQPGSQMTSSGSVSVADNQQKKMHASAAASSLSKLLHNIKQQ